MNKITKLLGLALLLSSIAPVALADGWKDSATNAAKTVFWKIPNFAHMFKPASASATPAVDGQSDDTKRGPVTWEKDKLKFVAETVIRVAPRIGVAAAIAFAAKKAMDYYNEKKNENRNEEIDLV